MKILRSLALVSFVIVLCVLALVSCGGKDEHVHVFADATCTAPKTCECGATEGEALGHTAVTDAAVAPTCTETGLSEGSHCSVCDTVLVAQTTVEALGHTTVTDAAVAPTCTETGLSEGSHCSVCDTVLVAQIEVPALGHTFIDGLCSCGAEYVAPETVWTLTTTLKNGDLVLIGAPAYGMLLSANKVSASSYYNKGVNYSADDFSNVTDAEIFVVTVNEDGTYTFTSLTGDVIALASSYSSLNKDGQHKSWALTDRGDGTFLVKNTGRNTYLEWYSSKNNWSTYTAGNTTEYYLSFYVKSTPAGEGHVHNHVTSVNAPTCTEAGYTSYTCSCGDSYRIDGADATGHNHVKGETVAPTCTDAGYTAYVCSCGDIEKRDTVDALGHSYADGTCGVCGGADPDYVKPSVPAGGSADFDTIVLPASKPNGDSSYTSTYTTGAGWIIVNSAIQCGGATNMNPQFTVIGSTNADKAVCINGKTSAPGKITSPTLEGGVSKIVITYTKIFTDVELSATVTVTDLATGTAYTHVIAKTLPSSEKYVVYTDEWTLDVAISGQFTIEIVNNSPTNQNSNKDRMTILSLEWSAPVHEHEYE